MRRHPNRRPLLTFVVVVLAALTARADVFEMKDGRTIDGKVIKEDGTFVWARTLKGVEKLTLADVATRTEGESQLEVMERLMKAVSADENDPDALWALYSFLSENAGEDKKLAKESGKILKRLLKAAPDHEEARDANGETRFDGRWVPKSDVARLEAEKERADLQREWTDRLSAKVEVYATDHFLLVDGTDDKDLVQRAEALETAYDLILELTGKEALWSGRSPTITLANHAKYLPVLDKFASAWGMSDEWMAFAKLETGGGVWRDRPEPMQVRFPNRGVEGMWYSTVHMLGHLAMWKYWGGQKAPPVWLEEGLGQWVEMEVMGEHLASCVGGKKDVGAGGTSDAAPRKKKKKGSKEDIDERKERCIEAVQDGTFPSMRLFLKLQIGHYGPAEEGGAYGLVTWLISRDETKVPELLAELKRASRDDQPWKAVYGYEVIEEMEKEWKTWVLTEW